MNSRISWCGSAILLVAGGLFGTARVLWAAAPELEAGVYIYDGASPLQVSYYSVPRVADWNSDGKKDLIVGQFSQCYVRVYLNQGTNSNPSFSGYSLIQSGGAPLTVLPYG